MSLAEKLAKPAPVVRARCGVAKVLTHLEGSDLEAVINALADDSFTGESIAEALRDEGFQIMGQTVQRHRRGMCSCVPG